MTQPSNNRRKTGPPGSTNKALITAQQSIDIEAMQPGNWIKRERKRRSWTQAELGSRLQPPVAHQQIQKWEKSDNLELRTLLRIHNALPIPEVGLLMGIENPASEVEIAPGIAISTDVARDLAEIASTDEGRGVLTELFRLSGSGKDALGQAQRILSAL